MEELETISTIAIKENKNFWKLRKETIFMLGFIVGMLGMATIMILGEIV